MPTVPNAYPNLPVVPYKKTTVASSEVAAYIDTLQIQLPVKKAVFAIFLVESRSGNAGINNNYLGLQADGSKLGRGFDTKVTATTLLTDSEGKYRRFCVFDKWQDCVDYVAALVIARGLFIGNYANSVYAKMQINDVTDLARAYYKAYVKGDAKAEPSTGKILDFKAKYLVAEARIWLNDPVKKK